MEKEVGRSDYFSPPPPQVQKDAHFFIAKLYLENGLNVFGVFWAKSSYENYAPCALILPRRLCV